MKKNLNSESVKPPDRKKNVSDRSAHPLNFNVPVKLMQYMRSCREFVIFRPSRPPPHRLSQVIVYSCGMSTTPDLRFIGEHPTSSAGSCVEDACQDVITANQYGRREGSLRLSMTRPDGRVLFTSIQSRSAPTSP